MAHFEYSAVISAPRSKVYDFLTDITNLKLIMAPDYKIELTSPLTKMKAEEEYQLRVTRYGISMLWGVMIEDFKPNEEFRDRQTYGPFALWVHTHKFEDHGPGTLLTDLIEYDVPFGLIGKLADDIIIRRELQKIFRHRHEKLQSLLL